MADCSNYEVLHLKSIGHDLRTLISSPNVSFEMLIEDEVMMQRYTQISFYLNSLSSR